VWLREGVQQWIERRLVGVYDGQVMSVVKWTARAFVIA
jgi:hypothetical protein